MNRPREITAADLDAEAARLGLRSKTDAELTAMSHAHGGVAMVCGSWENTLTAYACDEVLRQRRRAAA